MSLVAASITLQAVARSRRARKATTHKRRRVSATRLAAWAKTRSALHKFPRVRDAAVRHAVVRSTDTLFIPALWFHRILHHPRVERADARNIALTFTRQPPMPELLPFAAGLTRYWSDRRLHACEAPT